MLLDKVSFETQPETAPVQPVRMDVACFLGFVAERAPVTTGSGLRALLARQGFLGTDERRDGVATLYDRPVPVDSLADYSALFDGGSRLDRQARLTGARLATPLPAEVFERPMAVVIDGTLHEADLPVAGSNAEEVAALLAASLPMLEVSLTESDGDRSLSLARRLEDGAGTLAVLEHEGLGFPRPVHARASAIGSPMDAAIRQFFAQGGQRAYVVSLGPPLPLFTDPDLMASALCRLMGIAPVPAETLGPAMGQGFPPPHIPARERSGLTHLFGTEDVAFLLLPDLADLLARPRLPEESPDTAPRPLAEFALCTPQATSLDAAPVAHVALPNHDMDGLGRWRAVVDRCLAMITQHRRDIHLIADLPRTAEPVDLTEILPDSAFLVLAAPFVHTPFSEPLPGRAMGASAVLAGHLAAVLASRTPFVNPAAFPLRDVQGLAETDETDEDLPVNWITATVRGPRLTRDITCSEDAAWRPGGAGRLAARLVRMAGAVGEDILFSPISVSLMRDVRRVFENLLQRVAAAGAFQADARGPGFEVRCDRTTTTDNDIARGVLRAEVTFRAAASIEAIRVALPLQAARGGGAS